MKNVLVGLVLAAAVSTVACDRGEPGAIPSNREPLEIDVSRVAESAELTSFPATVRSTAEAELATRFSATVRRVAVDVGSRVSRGQLLVVLDPQDIEARIERAEASERQAGRYQERIQALERDGAATSQELDDAVARFEMARAAVQEALAQRAYAVLTAPFSGVIVGRSVDPGDLATPARPILRLVDPESLEVVTDLPGAYARYVDAGDTVTVVTPRDGSRHAARVTHVSPAEEARSHRYRVKVQTLDDTEGLVAGAFVRVELLGPGRAATWIPSDAVVRRGQLTGVFVVEDETARLRWIRLGQEQPDAVEVLAGLDLEAFVVRSPGPGLTDGAPVDRVTRVPFEVNEPAEAEADGGPATADDPPEAGS
jgi:RND family efflux transporter MFP subunit